MKKILCLMLALAVAQIARADFNDGVVEYSMGQYEQAYATMRSLAETADHGYAQYYVGMMHLNGQGVPQSDEEAARWFLKAAEHGIPQAQYKLGELYSSGHGVPRDFERAFAWYKTGAAHRHRLSQQAAIKAAALLTPEELKEAEKLSEKLVRAYGPKQDPEQPSEIKPE